LEAELVRRAARGDSAAQERLVRELTPRLLALATRLACASAEAEELASDALYRGLTRLGSLREPKVAGA